MPLRDHFHPPLTKPTTWEGFHGIGPWMLVQHLAKRLPLRDTVPSPRPPGAQIEIDVATFETDSANLPAVRTVATASPGSPLNPPLPSRPTCLQPTNTQSAFMTRNEVGGSSRRSRSSVPPTRTAWNTGRRSSPSVRRCCARASRCPSIDLVTSRHFNLYADLLKLIGHSDPTLGPEPPAIYAAACRWTPAWSEAHPRDRGRTRCRSGSRCPRCRCGWPRTSASPWNWKHPTRRPVASCALSPPDSPLTSLVTALRGRTAGRLGCSLVDR